MELVARIQTGKKTGRETLFPFLTYYINYYNECSNLCYLLTYLISNIGILSLRTTYTGNKTCDHWIRKFQQFVIFGMSAYFVSTNCIFCTFSVYNFFLMHSIKLEETTNTPFVHFNAQGSLEISGVSLTENSKDFYEPLVDWIVEYSKNPALQTVLSLNLEYLDSGSLGYFNIMMHALNDLHLSEKSVVSVIWRFEEDDADMEEYGGDLDEMFAFNLTLQPVQVED